jgi:hypothetical protein
MPEIKSFADKRIGKSGIVFKTFNRLKQKGNAAKALYQLCEDSMLAATVNKSRMRECDYEAMERKQMSELLSILCNEIIRLHKLKTQPLAEVLRDMYIMKRAKKSWNAHVKPATPKEKETRTQIEMIRNERIKRFCPPPHPPSICQ